jgi:hypothetical protein
MPKWEARVDAGLRESSLEHLLLEHPLLEHLLLEHPLLEHLLLEHPLLAPRLGVVYRGAL